MNQIIHLIFNYIGTYSWAEKYKYRDLKNIETLNRLKVIITILKAQLLETNIYGTTNLLINLRNLWLDLAIWTRNYMVSILSGYGNATAVGERLYRIPVDFYNRLQMIFGSQRAQGFVNLLSQHIIIMMNTVTAMKNKDNEELNKNTQLLYLNSNDLSNYLVSLNPYWTIIQWNTLLDQYINMTLQEMVALASGDFEKDIDIFDRITYFTVFLADYLTEGIVQYITFKQEPPAPIAPQVPPTPPAPSTPVFPSEIPK